MKIPLASMADAGTMQKPVMHRNTQNMKTMTVNFKEVGRDKKSWSVKMKTPISTSSIAREAKRTGRLMSSCVEAEMHDNGMTGVILVGGWRAVGGFNIEAC